MTASLTDHDHERLVNEGSRLTILLQPGPVHEASTTAVETMSEINFSFSPGFSLGRRRPGDKPGNRFNGFLETSHTYAETRFLENR